MAIETSNYKLEMPLETEFYDITVYNRNLGKIDTQMKLNANTVAVSRGGTGKTTWTASRLIYPSSSTTLTQVPAPTKTRSFLRQNTTGAPYWSAPSTTLEKTLLSSGWVGSAPPFTYTLSVAGVTTTSNQDILPDLDITEEELNALQAANIQDGGQAANSIVLKAWGSKPETDIPIRIIIRGDL
ncbi:hypothetical protein [Clostridium sp. D33t1_170424_F3]|uniref:hypothetical protein n=1 Tax=Clostridium sp. D33t1_170424_F3 TaxID=2787099 RepID=UPI0018AB8B1A|nr:hypothetical protein [Clostridium sp. D33t1_170424_F3]